MAHTIADTLDAIDSLYIAASRANQQPLAKNCERVVESCAVLRDISTGRKLSMRDLEITAGKYVELVCESLDLQAAGNFGRFGYVTTEHNGHKVFAR
jgi:hypothetical protein